MHVSYLNLRKCGCTIYSFQPFPLHVTIWIQSSRDKACIFTITVAALLNSVLEHLLAEICHTLLETGNTPADVVHADAFHSPGTHCWGQADHSDHGDTWQSTGQTCQHSRFETGLWSGWQLEHNHVTCWKCIHCSKTRQRTAYAHCHLLGIWHPLLMCLHAPHLSLLYTGSTVTVSIAAVAIVIQFCKHYCKVFSQFQNYKK